MFTSSTSTAKLDAALAKAQAEIIPATKDVNNDHFGKKYADIASVWEAARPALAKHGINVTQWPLDSTDGRLRILTRVAHDGEFYQCIFSMPVEKSNAHGYGSAITYARRFTLGPAVGIVSEEDDDGNAASKGARGNNNRNQDDHDQRPPQERRPTGKSPVTPKGNPPVVPKSAEAPPADPQSPPAEAAPAKPVDPRTEALGQLVDPVKWPKGSVAEYTKLRYGTAKVSELKEDQFAQLIATIKLMTASQAKADARAFLAAQEAEQAKANDWAKGVEAPAV